MKLALLVCALCAVASATAVHAASSEAAETKPVETSRERPQATEGTTAAADAASPRRSPMRSFADLAPRQKVMGLVNAVALLRTKIALMGEMKTAFEPRTGSPPTHGAQAAHPLPGPALAYIDCRLGLLRFEVCRHLGFLDSDPMVAPSSPQSKMLTLLGASSLVASLKTGHLYLQGDPDLVDVLGPELMDSAVRALGACWNAHLLFPAFDARPTSEELMREAMYHADAFLFLTAMHAKHILRFSRSDFQDVGALLASIFSDLPSADSVPSLLPRAGEREPQKVDSTSQSKDKLLRLPEVKGESRPVPAKAAPISAERAVPDKTTKVPEKVDASAARQEPSSGGILSGFLSRIFPTQTQQPPSLQEADQAAPPPTVLSAIAHSVGGLTSMVTGAAQSVTKPATIETPQAATDEDGLTATQKKIGGILDMLPEDVEGQF
ncbi:hypothetical protein ACSSS7_003088 [Eimeria intestinalis]